jgi:hypothetical protein
VLPRQQRQPRGAQATRAAQVLLVHGGHGGGCGRLGLVTGARGQRRDEPCPESLLTACQRNVKAPRAGSRGSEVATCCPSLGALLALVLTSRRRPANTTAAAAQGLDLSFDRAQSGRPPGRAWCQTQRSAPAGVSRQPPSCLAPLLLISLTFETDLASLPLQHKPCASCAFVFSPSPSPSPSLLPLIRSRSCAR